MCFKYITRVKHRVMSQIQSNARFNRVFESKVTNYYTETLILTIRRSWTRTFLFIYFGVVSNFCKDTSRPVLVSWTCIFGSGGTAIFAAMTFRRQKFFRGFGGSVFAGLVDIVPLLFVAVPVLYLFAILSAAATAQISVTIWSWSTWVSVKRFQFDNTKFKW